MENVDQNIEIGAHEGNQHSLRVENENQDDASDEGMTVDFYLYHKYFAKVSLYCKRRIYN